MSNYKSKTPEEAFARSQSAHFAIATRYSWDQNPDVQVRRVYHERMHSLQEKACRILPLAYRRKVFDSIENKIKGNKK